MLFSIIIPCRDRIDDLRRAIQSCVSQTYDDFEILIIDDYSSIDLVSLCNSFADARIRYFRNAVNLGVSRTRNSGIENAGGAFCLFLDSDDVYLPDKLARVAAHISAHPDAAVLFHAQYRLLPNGRQQVIPGRAPHPGEGLDDFILVNGNHVQTNSYVIRADIARRVQFDENCSLFEDTRFIIETSFASGGYQYIDAPLSIYDDRNGTARLSKLIDPRAMATFRDFVNTRCSGTAAAGFTALVCSHMSFWNQPAGVLSGLWRGYRNGVSAVRTIIYLLRSTLGARTVNRVVSLFQR